VALPEHNLSKAALLPSHAKTISRSFVELERASPVRRLAPDMMTAATSARAEMLALHLGHDAADDAGSNGGQFRSSAALTPATVGFL
jgi:hypothetical protein